MFLFYYLRMLFLFTNHYKPLIISFLIIKLWYVKFYFNQEINVHAEKNNAKRCFYETRSNSSIDVDQSKPADLRRINLNDVISERI